MPADLGYTSDQIAVVGLAGRFPGAPDVPALWRLLVDGVDAIHDYTVAELRASGIGESLLADPAHVPHGGHLPGVDEFDAALFGFTAHEAELLDPQQRLFLEAAWAALDDAAVDPGRVDGSIGVFASASPNRYFLFHLFGNSVDPEDWEGRLPPGWSADYLPAQAAYRLGLTGPAVAVQTACSSSLVATCLAAQNLLDLRCDVAIAGGASVTWPRHRAVTGGLVSPDGRCRAFDADAAGTGFGSGVAVVVLKRLDDALADGSHIHAVLRGWAVNNDGAARAGFAAPGVDGQAAVVVEALASAGLTAAEVGFVEAHGSGTLLGDAIEVAALTRAFAATGEAPPGSCALGSIKTNIGHLDAAAGSTGLIKAILAVHHGLIPASLHFNRPNPEIDFARSPFAVPRKTVDWPAGARRIAGVSSFGLGGTNAHVLVEEPPRLVPPGAPAGPGLFVLPVSAATPEALADVLALLAAHLAAAPYLPVTDVAHTLAVGRRSMPYRAAVLCRSTDEAVAALDGLAVGLVADPGGVGGALADLARRWVAGAEVDWSAEAAIPGGRRVPLPTYPFQRQRYWVEPRRDG